MKLFKKKSSRRLCLLLLISQVSSFHLFQKRYGSTKLSMVLGEPPKKLPKIEILKINSDHLLHPLAEELPTDELSVSHDGYQILKYHGSYMQTDREKRGKPKDYQFMLRLKQPGGELSAELYRLLDDLSDKYGQGDLRITTRQCFQMHGIRKGNLKTVISSIMNIGSSTIGACGDVSRNVMTTPAPFKTPEYKHVNTWAKVVAQLLRPLSPAFNKLWLDGDQPKQDVVWNKDVEHMNIDAAMLYDSGRGIILKDATEPIYGDRYLPRKFKVGITVPGDNSIDIYTNDIGLVVVCDEKGELEGFNVMVGGGMGRTHNKETTFARVADHLGFVPVEHTMELLKSIVASQRDHGNGTYAQQGNHVCTCCGSFRFCPCRTHYGTTQKHCRVTERSRKPRCQSQCSNEILGSYTRH